MIVREAEARWQGAGVDFAEAMAGGLELMDRLVGYQAVLVVDAAVTGQAQPGEIYTLDAESLGASVIGGAHGAHLGTALELGRTLGVRMPRVAVLAIEAADVATIGETLTPAIRAAVEPAVADVLVLAAELLEEVRADA
jgi:hydrogenase maturation protease